MTLLGQPKNQSDISDGWSEGTYDTFEKNSRGSFTSAEKSQISFKKNSDNVVSEITIDGTKHEKWGRTGSTWVSGYSRNNSECLFFTDDGLSIIKYSLDNSTNTVSSAYKVYGENSGKEREIIKLINSYLAHGQKIMTRDIAESKKDQIKYSLNNQEITDLKIEIIAIDKTLDCGSEFEVGYIVTKTDGLIIKSKNLGGKAVHYDYSIKVYGAVERKDGSYKANPYCDGYTDEELVITVIANGANSITKTVTFPVNCVPDPVVLAQKNKEKAERINRRRIAIAKKAAAAAKEEYKEQHPTTTTAVKQAPVGVTITDDNTNGTMFFPVRIRDIADKTEKAKEKIKQSLTHINTVEIDKEMLLIGMANTKENRNMPAIYVLNNDQLEPLILDLGDFSFLKKTAFRDIEKISSTEIIVASDNGLLKMVKTATGYKTTNFFQAPAAEPLFFTDIVAIDGDKCASIGYTKLKNKIPGFALPIAKDVSYSDYESKDEYKSSKSYKIPYDDYRRPNFKFKCKAYLIIWDHKAGTHISFPLGNDISEESVLTLGNDGSLIYSLGQKPTTMVFGKEDSQPFWYGTANNTISSLDAVRSFNDNKFRFNWIVEIDNGSTSDDKLPFVITDLLVESNNNILFSGIARRVQIHYNNDKYFQELHSSYVGLGRITQKGAFHQFVYSSGLNQSLWGGSDKGSLAFTLMPGKLYYSDYGNPKLILAPDSKGYIMLHKGAYDQIKYPEGGYRNSDSEIYGDNPLFSYIDKSTLETVSFDLVHTNSYRRGNQPFNNYAANLISYNSTTQKYTLFHSAFKRSRSSYKWEFKPTFNKTWKAAALVEETKSNTNQVDKLIEEFKARTAAEKAREKAISDAFDASYNSSYSGSGSGSRASKPKYVTVYNKTGNDIYYVEKSSRNCTRINVNSSARLDCFKDYWYTFNANDGINGGNSNHPKLYNANSNCGNEVV
jgi:hypothetical protein